MNRRKLLVAVGLGVLVAPLAAFAQQPGKVWRIGFLAPRSRPTPSDPDVYSAFPQGMRELGYVEGKIFVVEWRFADGKFERLPGLAAELVKMKVDVIVAAGTVATEAAQRATTTIPIVIAASLDPVGSGFVKSLARPGGNITGLSLATSDFSPKHLELLMTAMPKLSRVAVLVNPDNSAHPGVLKSVQAAAQKLGVQVLTVNARTPEDIERGIAMMRRERAEGVIVAADAFFILQRRQIAELALRHRLASIAANREHAEAGDLMSYGQNVADFYRRAATFVDKILKGAKPGDLPIEQPAIFELVINRKTAKTLGITIPQELLLRADKVIE